MDLLLQFSISPLHAEIACNGIVPENPNQRLRELKAMTIDIVVSHNGMDSLSATRKFNLQFDL